MLRRGALILAVALATASVSFGQGTFESSLVFGNWSDAGTWTLTGGSDGDGIPDSDDNVTIVSGDIVTLDANGACNNLTVQAGGLFYANTSSPRLLDVYGTTLTNNGTIGNGSTVDGIIFRLYGSGSATLSGSGDFDALRLLFAGSSDMTLTVQSDITLRGSGPVVYNVGTGGTRDFNMTIDAGKTVTATTGNVSLDGAAGNGSNDTGGTWTVNGTLDVGGTLYLESNNTATTGNLAQISVGATGTVKAAQASTSSAGTDRFDLTTASGATLEFTSGDFGDLAGGTTFNFNANSTVNFSGGAVTFSYPDGDSGATADTDVDNLLKLSGSGTKTYSGDLTINATLTICGSASLSVTGSLVYNSTLEYNGTSAQTMGGEWPASNGPTSLIVNNAAGVIMTGNRTLSSGITMTSGNLDTGIYTLDLGTTGSITGETDSKRIIGAVQATRTVSGAETFGNLGFAFAAGGTDPDAAVTVKRISGTSGIVKIGSNESIARKFDVTYAGSNFSKALTFSWLPSEDNGKTLESMELWRFGGDWDKISLTPQDASSTRSVTETITRFSLYTVSDAFNPLPVELVSFDAVADRTDILLNWETASETNNAGFEVQMAVADTVFEALTFVEGAGTTLDPQMYSYRVADMEPGAHVFRLKQIDFDGTFEYSPLVEIIIELPEVYALSAAYPNPFNPQTQFTLSVAREQAVRVEVYDVMGRRIATLFDGVLRANQAHPFAFDASSLPSGLYFYRAIGETFTETRSMVLQK
ncbi:MAG: T9SS type A sorting domain-containing protein [Rhodothermales bacterium]